MNTPINIADSQLLISFLIDNKQVNFNTDYINLSYKTISFQSDFEHELIGFSKYKKIKTRGIYLKEILLDGKIFINDHGRNSASKINQHIILIDLNREDTKKFLEYSAQDEYMRLQKDIEFIVQESLKPYFLFKESYKDYNIRYSQIIHNIIVEYDPKVKLSEPDYNLSILKNLLKEIKHQKTYPFLFRESIVSESLIKISGPCEIITCYSPIFSMPKDIIRFNWSIFLLLELIVQIYKLRIVHISIIETSIYRLDIVSYAKQSINEKDILKFYESVVLRDRIEASNIITSSLSFLQTLVPEKSSTFYDEIFNPDLTYYELEPNEINKKRLLSLRLKRDYFDEIQSIPNDIEKLKIKSEILSEWFRDLSNLKSHESNIKLQKKIKWLTKIALLIGFLGLFITLINIITTLFTREEILMFLNIK
jgi:hypothetical protein